MNKTQLAANSPHRGSDPRKNAPIEMQLVSRWIIWSAKPRLSGKVTKIPINSSTGRSINANDPKNWMSFTEACAAADRCKGSGIGFVLANRPVTAIDGQSMHLVAIDLDSCGDHKDEIKQLRKTIGPAYIEVSPSGEGLHIFALSKTPPKGGNDGAGHEMYSDGRFMTVTGTMARGSLIDATDALCSLNDKWFGNRRQPRGVPLMLAHLISRPSPETQENIERIKSQLAYISADCGYETWIRIVWSVLSSGWKCAETLARDWSASAPHRYDAQKFDQVCRSFDPGRSPSLGTLAHMAREEGWQPVRPASAATAHPVNVERKELAPSRLLTRDALNALPPAKWIIRGVLPARGLAAAYGPSGSGKTFLALDMACSIAAGRPNWFGSKVRSAPVAYVALEGQAGIKGRIAAWEMQHGEQVPKSLRFLLGDFTLLQRADADALAADILEHLGPGAVVAVDTLNQSSPGADENSSAEMGRVISNAKFLAEAVDGVVVLVHHAGKDSSRGMRGHSSLFAAMDSVLEVSSGPTGRAWRLSKSKEGESGAQYGFELVSHVVGRDEDGFDVRSCAVAPLRLGLPAPAAPARPVTGKHQKAALEALKRVMAAHPDGIPVMTVHQAIGAALDCPDKHRATRTAEVIKGLTEAGHLQQVDGGAYVLA